ncbi:MAG: zinc ribbon domain-containing protein [Acinetobacter sp.]
MAMIQCPECGQNISDKAIKCIHCGKEITKETVSTVANQCLECGGELSEADTYCPVCGCPKELRTESDAAPIQAVEVAGVKVSKKIKKTVVISIIALMVCVVLAFGIKYAGDMKSEKEFIATYNAYIGDLKTAQVLMISGGSDAETLCNLTYRVWYNSIYEEYDSATDPYTRPDSYWVKDFNAALTNLYAAASTSVTVSSIEQNQTDVKEMIKNLQNPPEGLEKCYDTLTDLHSAYKLLTDMAISPSGNLNGFSEKKSDAVSDFMEAYEKLDNQIPESKTDK